MQISNLAGNFKGAIGQLDTVIKAARGLLCLPYLLKSFNFTSPTSLLKGLAGFAAGIALSAANVIADAINDRINSLIGIATLPLRMLQQYAKSIINIINNTKSILKNVETKAENLLNFNKNTQNCAVQAANFMNCIMTAITKRLTKRILAKAGGSLKKLDNQFDRLQRDIQAEAFRAGGLLEQHVGRQLKAAEKLTKQLSILTR